MEAMTWSSAIAPPPQGALDARRVRAFGAARRHSLLVRTLRWAVPAVALVLGLGFVMSGFLDRRDGAPAAPAVGQADVVSGASVTMERPRMTGYNSERNSYQVSADTARQNIATPGLVDLSAMSALMQLGAQGKAHLEALTGRFNSEKQLLDLEQDVYLKTERGDEVHLSRANVDLGTGAISSNQPVRVSTGNAVINAETMDVVDNGDRILFQGKVVMIMQPNAPGGPAAEGAGP